VNGRLERDVSGALDQVLHLGRMIDLLMDSTRIAEGRLTFEYGEVDVAALVRAVADRMSQPAVAAACALRLDIPEAPELRAGRWDRGRVDQLVTNLLSNAIKYGAGKPIDLCVRRVGDRARITVTDQGPGIAVEQQARLFERFARLASSRHYGGFGLGLWIAREIVRAHDGSIRIESQPGDGASFIVELPLAGLPDRP